MDDSIDSRDDETRDGAPGADGAGRGDAATARADGASDTAEHNAVGGSAPASGTMPAGDASTLGGNSGAAGVGTDGSGVPAIPADLDEPRIVTETGLDARVAAIVAPVIRDLGFRLVRAKISARNGCTLQIMAERADGTMTVGDCETVSRNVSPVLDVEDPIAKAYYLEVSSPGIDRPLMRRSDFARWVGHLAKLEMAVAQDGRKRYRGFLAGIDGDHLLLDLEDAPKDGERRVRLPVEDVGEAHLMLTDELIAAALKAEKRRDRDAALGDLAGEFEDGFDGDGDDEAGIGADADDEADGFGAAGDDGDEDPQGGALSEAEMRARRAHLDARAGKARPVKAQGPKPGGKPGSGRPAKGPGKFSGKLPGGKGSGGKGPGGGGGGRKH